MKSLQDETRVAFERRMERAGVPVQERAAWQKWVMFYLDFCVQTVPSQTVKQARSPLDL